jgi:hypothetical protein
MYVSNFRLGTCRVKLINFHTLHLNFAIPIGESGVPTFVYRISTSILNIQDTKFKGTRHLSFMQFGKKNSIQRRVCKKIWQGCSPAEPN